MSLPPKAQDSVRDVMGAAFPGGFSPRYGERLVAHSNLLFFFGEREPLDSPRPALNIGLGGFLSSQTIALSARVGFDLFIGQHYVISAGAVGIGASSTLVGNETVKIKPVVGSDFILSFNF